MLGGLVGRSGARASYQSLCPLNFEWKGSCQCIGCCFFEAVSTNILLAEAAPGSDSETYPESEP